MCDWCGSLQEWGDVVAATQLALHWMCNPQWTGCVPRTTPTYMWQEQAITEWSLLLLAAAVWSFAHLPNGLSACNTTKVRGLYTKELCNIIVIWQNKLFSTSFHVSLFDYHIPVQCEIGTVVHLWHNVEKSLEQLIFFIKWSSCYPKVNFTGC